METNQQNTPNEVVHYYNLYKLDNKNKRDNKYVGETPTDKDNILGSLRSDLASRSASQDIPLQEESLASQVGNLSDAEPVLNEDMIARAVIQFFDNGEKSRQRFKIKVRFNLVDKENPEFIATLTKDWSNFKKYIPAECREYVMESARQFRADVKAKYNVVPYMGKFHLNTGKQTATTKGFTNIEPNTLAFVWYDNVNSQWKYFIMFYDFMRNGTFDATYVTQAQTRVGVKTQDLYINPKYDNIQRPKTWAQQRAEQRSTK